MSQWAREFPHLVGSDADPWMRNEGYARVAPMSEMERDLLRDERAAVEDDERRARVEERAADDSAKPPEGWGLKGQKFHYFTEGRPLCGGKYEWPDWYSGRLAPDDATVPNPDDCAACRRALATRGTA